MNTPTDPTPAERAARVAECESMISYYVGTYPASIRDDMAQEARIAVYNTAAQKFDPNRGTSFKTYAATWIRSAAKRYYRYNCSVVKYPAHESQVTTTILPAKIRGVLETSELEYSAYKLKCTVEDVAPIDTEYLDALEQLALDALEAGNNFPLFNGELKRRRNNKLVLTRMIPVSHLDISMDRSLSDQGAATLGDILESDSVAPSASSGWAQVLNVSLKVVEQSTQPALCKCLLQRLNGGTSVTGHSYAPRLLE